MGERMTRVNREAAAIFWLFSSIIFFRASTRDDEEGVDLVLLAAHRVARHHGIAV